MEVNEMDVITFALCKKMINNASIGGGDNITTIVTEVKQEVVQVQQEVTIIKDDISSIKEDLSDNVEAIPLLQTITE